MKEKTATGLSNYNEWSLRDSILYKHFSSGSFESFPFPSFLLSHTRPGEDSSLKCLIFLLQTFQWQGSWRKWKVDAGENNKTREKNILFLVCTSSPVFSPPLPCPFEWDFDSFAVYCTPVEFLAPFIEASIHAKIYLKRTFLVVFICSCVSSILCRERNRGVLVFVGLKFCLSFGYRHVWLDLIYLLGMQSSLLLLLPHNQTARSNLVVSGIELVNQINARLKGRKWLDMWVLDDKKGSVREKMIPIKDKDTTGLPFIHMFIQMLIQIILMHKNLSRF